jgi:hypothetical protein
VPEKIVKGITRQNHPSHLGKVFHKELAAIGTEPFSTSKVNKCYDSFSFSEQI